MSQFKKRSKEDAKLVDYNLKGKCNTCGVLFKLYKRLSNGKYNRVPFSDCQDCWKKNNPRIKRNDVSKGRNVPPVGDASAITFSISTIQANVQPLLHESENLDIHLSPQAFAENECDGYSAAVQLPTVLRHHIFTDRGWKLTQHFI